MHVCSHTRACTERERTREFMFIFQLKFRMTGFIHILFDFTFVPRPPWLWDWPGWDDGELGKTDAHTYRKARTVWAVHSDGGHQQPGTRLVYNVQHQEGWRPLADLWEVSAGSGGSQVAVRWKLQLIISAHVCTWTRGRLYHSHGAEAPGSLTWPCTCQ